MGFDGFSKATLRFLEGLGANNMKAWFDAHRDDYERDYLAPAQAFVEALGPRLRKLDPDVHAEPRVNGSILASSARRSSWTSSPSATKPSRRSTAGCARSDGVTRAEAPGSAAWGSR